MSHGPDLEGVFAPGERVFIPGASGEPMGVVDAIYAAPELARDVAFTTTFVPGINPFRIDGLHVTTRVTGLFMQPTLREAQRTGRYRHVPLSYAGFSRRLADGHEAFDACVVQVSPPDRTGRCSLGPAAEFTPAVIAHSRRVVAVINPQVPFCPSSPSLPFASFARVLEASGAPRTYEPGALDPIAIAIGHRVAAFVEDDSALQIGLGKAPAALMTCLRDRKRLRLHSGMLSDGAARLVEAKALHPKWRHLTCVLVGSAELYAWAAEHREIHVVGCEHTHAPAVLAGLPRFVAVNSALEVDLFGQCNLELANGHAVSGPGGAPDFARAAKLSPGGISIVALPAAVGAGSRIVARLASAFVTLPRTDVDVVVTEHGAADLRGLSVRERAEQLIEIAPPVHRASLAEQWTSIADEL